VGIRPGEKIHEILVNEYELQRVSESETYFTIHPEYRLPEELTPQALGSEYSSENTRRLKTFDEITPLLDAAGVVEEYT
jgi:FlaA1/EpsC-like NDP-sugar epimerase